jgi:hypothetical protein
MGLLANVALTNTFDTWRTRTNQVLTRINQFAINESSLYANTLTANSSFTSKGLATFNGRATVGTNLTVSGNTTLGAAGKTMTTSGAWTHTGALSTTNFTVSGNSTIGGSGKTIGLTGTLTHTGTANVSGWFGVAGRATVSTNLFVGANTYVMGRLGVGTTTPGDAITVVRSTGEAVISITNSGTGSSWLGLAPSPTGAAYIYNSSNVPTIFTTNGIEVFRLAASGLGTFAKSATVTQNLTVSGNTIIGSSGRLGIGTTTPGYPLVLAASQNSDLVAQIINTNVGALASGILQVQVGASSYVNYSTRPTYNQISGSGITTQYIDFDTQIFRTTAGTEVARFTNGGLKVAANTTLAGTTTDNSNARSQTLTDGATINWDVSLGRVATVTLGGNRTMAAPTNLKVGTYILTIIQDATGSRTITWNTVFKWTAGVAPPLTTTANAKDVFSFFSDGTNLFGSFMPDVR